jgi:hypothetical protein
MSKAVHMRQNMKKPAYESVRHQFAAMFIVLVMANV